MQEPGHQPDGPRVEHLVTWEEDGGQVVVLGLDEECRPISVTTLYSYR